MPCNSSCRLFGGLLDVLAVLAVPPSAEEPTGAPLLSDMCERGGRGCFNGQA